MELRFRGWLVRHSKDAVKNMGNLDIDSALLLDLLEYGKDYRDSKMSERGGEVTFMKLVPSYSMELDEEIWFVKHVGVAGLEE
ncbi:MAG TPA: hypothetical protein VI893_07125 [Thermoplasmata archaeon]|nr:hypothetical protein [Thermoplasmata archaeon]